MPKPKPTVRTRGLGAELRTLRIRANLTIRAVAERLGWSASTISRIETGNRTVSSDDVSALLVLYGVTGDEREQLLTLAKAAHQPGWWETRNPGLPSQLTALLGFESTATRIVDVETALIPGLLQTADYTRALMTVGGLSDVDIETRVAIRMGRQAVLSRTEPPELLAIIDEAALRRPLGGRQVMADQLRHVIRMSERPNITVQVIPFECGGHAAMNGPYLVLEFPKARTIVHLEHKRSGVFVDDPEDVEPYLESTEILSKTALDPAASAKLLAAAAEEYERR